MPNDSQCVQNSGYISQKPVAFYYHCFGLGHVISRQNQERTFEKYLPFERIYAILSKERMFLHGRGRFYGGVKTTLAGGEASLPKLRALPARKSSSGWQCETKVSVLRSYHCSDGKESETL